MISTSGREIDLPAGPLAAQAPVHLIEEDRKRLVQHADLLHRPRGVSAETCPSADRLRPHARSRTRSCGRRRTAGCCGRAGSGRAAPSRTVERRVGKPRTERCSRPSGCTCRTPSAPASGMRLHKPTARSRPPGGSSTSGFNSSIYAPCAAFYRLIVAFGIAGVVGIGDQDDLREALGDRRRAAVRRGVVHDDDLERETAAARYRCCASASSSIWRVFQLTMATESVRSVGGRRIRVSRRATSGGGTGRLRGRRVHTCPL